MPLLSSQSGISAKATGLTSSLNSSIGGGYWSTILYKASPLQSSYGQQNSYVDGSGNLYLPLLVQQGDDTAYIVKYDSSGAIVWQRYLGNSGSSESFIAATQDSSGNVYTSGFTTNGPGNGVLVVKYNSSGVIQWQKVLIPAFTSSNGYAISTDPSGNIYVSGYLYTGLTTSWEPFIVKLDSSGNILWQKVLSANSTQFAYNIALDSAGNNIYIVGVDTSISPYLGLIFKYNSSGVLQWQKQLTGSNNISLTSVEVDSTGNIYVCGKLETSPGKAVVAKYDSSGNILWGKEISDSLSANLNAIDLALDSSNNVYINTVISGVSRGWGSIKLDSSGNLLWAREFLMSSSGGYGIGVRTYGSSVYSIGGYTETTGVVNEVITNFPTDGSRTGYYAFPDATSDMTYKGLSVSLAANSWTTSTSSFSDTTGSFAAPANTTLTDAAGLLQREIVT